VNYIEDQNTHHPDEPWFVYVPYNAAHDPFQVPPADLHSVDLGELLPGEVSNTLANYKAMVEAMDTEIGRLLSVVDMSRTTVIYMGDNGTPAQVKDTNTGVRGSKISVYEGGVRVPLVVAGAGVTRIGEREDALVIAGDLFATILTLAGVSSPMVNDSYSFVPLLSDADATPGRQYAFTETCFSGSRVAIRGERYKLLHEPAPGTNDWRLYDMEADPLEATNLYDDGAHLAARTELIAAYNAIQVGGANGCLPVPVN
jgi:arylsulfatase A-like enzyme